MIYESLKRIIPPIALLSFILPIALPQSAQAGRIEPEPVTCWFFRGEALELKNTCTYESTTWAGGGGQSLNWEDGVKTSMAFGLVGRGTPACKNSNETSVDDVCGKRYGRHPQTLKRLSDREADRVSRNNISCVEVKKKSICWLR